MTDYGLIIDYNGCSGTIMSRDGVKYIFNKNSNKKIKAGDFVFFK